MVIPGLGPVSQGALALLIPIIAIIGALERARRRVTRPV